MNYRVLSQVHAALVLFLSGSGSYADTTSLMVFSNGENSIGYENMLELHEICKINPFAQCPTPNPESFKRLRIEVENVSNCTSELTVKSDLGLTHIAYDILETNLRVLPTSQLSEICDAKCRLGSHAMFSISPEFTPEHFSTGYILTGGFQGIDEVVIHPHKDEMVMNSMTSGLQVFGESISTFVVPVLDKQASELMDFTRNALIDCEQ